MSDLLRNLVNKIEYPRNILFETIETSRKENFFRDEVDSYVTLCVRAPVSRIRLLSILPYKYGRSGDRLNEVSLSSSKRLEVTERILEELE